MSESKNDAIYTMGRSKEEEDRLIQQSQLYDAVTRRFLREAGLRSGMRVLDVGSGTGEVATAAADLVRSARLGRRRRRQPGDSRDRPGAGERSRTGNVEFIAGNARTLDLGGRLRRPGRPPGPHVHGRSGRGPETACRPRAPGRGSRLPGGGLQHLPEHAPSPRPPWPTS